MALAHQLLSDQAKLPGARAARIMIALCSVALLSACAGFTEHVAHRGEPSAPSARPPAQSDAAAMPARYVSLDASHSAIVSVFYDDRKASRAARASLQSGTRMRQYGLRRTGAASGAQARVAHVAPTLSGDMSDSIAAPDSEGTASRSHGVSKVDVSSIAFNVPTSMTLDRRTLIQLALAATGEPGADGIAPTTTDAAPHMAQYIEARLSGGDFVIEPVSANTQALSTAKTTEWMWLVTPKKAGKQQLQLTVTALTDAGSVPMHRVLPTFEHTVLVSTRWQDDLRARIETHAAWLWAAVSAAPLLLLWLYVRWRRKHRRWFRGGL